MIIVSGALYVSAGTREAYLAGCRPVVELARATPGCLDFALSADLVDGRRINVLERWATPEALVRFRGSGPSDEQQGVIEDADVREFEVADEPPAGTSRPLPMPGLRPSLD